MSQLNSSNGVTKVWYNQILSSRGISESTFSNGAQYFEDNARGGISHRDYSASYFRVRAKALYVGAGPGFVERKLAVADGVAMAMNTPSLLYQGISYDIAGTTIEDISNFCAELDTYSVRTAASKALMDSVMATTCFFQASFAERQQFSCSDGIQKFFNNAGLVVKDSTSTVLLAASLPSTPFQCEFYEFIWMPKCLGLSKLNMLIPPSVPIRFTLTPYNASSIPVRCLESVSSISIGKPATTQGFYFAVVDMQLYVKNVDRAADPNFELLIPLECCNVQPTNLQNTTSNNNTYTVPDNTTKISLAYADSRRGSDNRYSASKFRVNQAITATGTTSDELNLTRWSIKYGATQLPVQSPDPSFSSVATWISQGYFEHLISNGLASKEGGAENLQDWIERGAVYTYNFPENNTRATNVNVQSYFNGNYSNTTELLFYTYMKVVRVMVSNERVVSVTTN